MKRSTRIIAYILTGALLAATLTGCKYRITDQSVEEEVAEALERERESIAAEERDKILSELEEMKKQDEAAAAPKPVLEPDEAAMTDSELDKLTAVEATAADDSGNVESQVEAAPDDDTLQIVFFGDSIFDSVRDETGIAYMVGADLGADVYNLSIGGTTCALTRSKLYDLGAWPEANFLGVLYAMEGKVDRSILNGYKAGEIMNQLDPKRTDYFIIEYGTNDFLSYIPTGAENTGGQFWYYYSDSLRYGIRQLQENYPDAKIILCTPYYEQFWSADRTRFIGDVHSVNNGLGTLLDYIGAMEGVATEENVSCLNMYTLMEIDTYTVDKMTTDGIHPNEEARRKYAGLLENKIRELEGQ